MRYLSIIFLVFSFFGNYSAYAQLPSETTAINQLDAKGYKQGDWKKTDKEGRLVYEGKFINDKPAGRFTYYDTTGKVRAFSEFSENGAKCFTTAFYKGGGKMSEGLYVNEKREGLWKFYNEEGVLVADENYVNGIAEGLWKTYYQNGALLEEITYKNGEKEGPWKQYFFDGPLKLSARYKQGKLEGLATFYYASGRVMVSGPYTNNFKDGVWIHLNEKGVAEKKEVWAGGFLQAEEYYDKEVERMVKEEK